MHSNRFASPHISMGLMVKRTALLFLLCCVISTADAMAQNFDTPADNTCMGTAKTGYDKMGSLGNVAIPIRGGGDTWAQVDKYNNLILEAQQNVYKETGVLVPANRIKAQIMMESSGDNRAYSNGAPTTCGSPGSPILVAYGLMSVTTCSYIPEASKLAIGTPPPDQVSTITGTVYDPAVNLRWGILELAKRCKDNPGDSWRKISADNFCIGCGETTQTYSNQTEQLVAQLDGSDNSEYSTTTGMVSSGSPLAPGSTISVMTLERCSPSKPVDAGKKTTSVNGMPVGQEEGSWTISGGEKATEGMAPPAAVPPTGSPVPSLPDKTKTEQCEQTLTTDNDPVKITPVLGFGDYISGGGEPDPLVAEGVTYMREQAKLNFDCAWCHPYIWGGHGGFTIDEPETKAKLPQDPKNYCGGDNKSPYPDMAICPMQGDENVGFDCSGLVQWGYIYGAKIPEGDVVGPGDTGTQQLYNSPIAEKLTCTREEIMDPNQTCWATGDMILTNMGGDEHVQVYLGWNPDANCAMIVESTCPGGVSHLPPDPGDPFNPSDPSPDACGAQEHCARAYYMTGFEDGDGRRLKPTIGGAVGGTGTNKAKDEFIMGQYVKAMLSGEVIAWENGTISLYVDLNGRQCVMHYSGLDGIIQLYPGTKVLQGQRIGAVKADDAGISRVSIYLSCDSNNTCIKPMSIINGNNTTFCRKSKSVPFNIDERKHARDQSAFTIYTPDEEGNLVKEAAACSKYAVISSQPERIPTDPAKCGMHTLHTEVLAPVVKSEILYKNLSNTTLYRGSEEPINISPATVPEAVKRKLKEQLEKQLEKQKESEQ